MQITLAAGTTGVGIATDLRDGIIDRFRSLPIAQPAVLVGRTTADLARNAFGATVMVAAGFAIGYRPHGGVLGAIAALAVALLFGYAITWVFAAVGLAVKDPEAANFIGFAPVLLFVYLSSAWVPIDTMHPAVRGFARHQPVNVTIEAVRSLANGTATPTQWIPASPGPSPSSPSSRGSPPDSSAQQPPDHHRPNAAGRHRRFGVGATC